MDGNKLKHRFGKKEKTEIHRNGRLYPMGVVDGVDITYEQPPRFEVSSVEEVIVERRTSMDALNTYGDQREEVKKAIKDNMAKELGLLLLEGGYVESLEVIYPASSNTKMIMKIKAKKIIQ